MMICMLVTALVWAGMVMTDEPIEQPVQEAVHEQSISDAQ